MSNELVDITEKTTYLKSYQPPTFFIEKTALTVELFEDYSWVTSTLLFCKNELSPSCDELFLHGESITLLEVSIDGVPLGLDEYSVSDVGLTLLNPKNKFTLKTKVLNKPQDNTSLEGLYKSRTMFCTQCEAEGFRKITYYLDRPDVMSDFTTTIVADKSKYPILLSNGNLLDNGLVEDGRHYATWHDPFKKPCYLFALVAGDLACITDSFTTFLGRDVTLQIFVEEKDLDKCEHAMESLKNAMRWDEEVYGREYDLNVFMIVAVDDFNMGAMENKGLNIFNTSCVLAKPDTTTDQGYQRVEAVVAHEYFHNWSGNRVTCRDWFQLSLKEGFTVYRDSEFSSDMGSRAVKRIEDVATLRTFQFAEDAGPMAHAVRPEAYMEISNFYTLTIYEKGCEVVRMMANLLGSKLFRKATDLYFDRHDAQAVTTDDFVQAMEDVSGKDLTQFKRWYSQAGTPVITVTDKYDNKKNTYILKVQQSTPATPECTHKLPFHVPIAVSLLGDDGELTFEYDNNVCHNVVLELTEDIQTFTFSKVAVHPIPSLLRGFSAPVKLDYDYSRVALSKLMLQGTDEFNCWEAGQILALTVLDDAIKAYDADQLDLFVVDDLFIGTCKALLKDKTQDKALLALMLTLPSEKYIAEQYDVVDVEAIHYAYTAVSKQLSQAIISECMTLVSAYNISADYKPDAQSIANRSLKNIALQYVLLNPTDSSLTLCYKQFELANNMTDQMAALSSLVNCSDPRALPLAESALAAFYSQWSGEALVVNQWFGVQARNASAGSLERVWALLAHPAYDGNNPNKIRALISGFCNFNPIGFHSGTVKDEAAGYKFLADQVIALDKKNPQIAARLLTPLVSFRRYSASRQIAMKHEVTRIKNSPKLSKDVLEVVSKSLIE